MRAWYIPSRTGDFRLERHPDDPTRSVLTTEDMTPDEAQRVGKFLLEAKNKGWVRNHLIPSNGRNELEMDVAVHDAGPLLAADVLPGRGVLTVVKSMKGTVMAVVDESGQVPISTDQQLNNVESQIETLLNRGETLSASQKVELARLQKTRDHLIAKISAKRGAAKKKEATPATVPDAAVTVRRHTTCCPNPIPVEGPLKRSSRVLREFCTPSQWRSWVDNGFLHCRGQLTGVRYRLVHREHPLAARQGKICRDLDHGVTLHFYNCWVPPAEEVLAAKLILENREPWLRNEATFFGRGERFKNPMGTGLDGTWDAQFFRNFGAFFDILKNDGVREQVGQISFNSDGTLLDESIVAPFNIVAQNAF